MNRDKNRKCNTCKNSSTTDYGFSRCSFNGSSTNPRQSYCILHSLRIVCIRSVSYIRAILVKYNSFGTKLPDLKPAFLQCCTFTYFQIQITIAFVGRPIFFRNLCLKPAPMMCYFFGLNNRIVINSTFSGFDISQNDLKENAHK